MCRQRALPVFGTLDTYGRGVHGEDLSNYEEMPRERAKSSRGVQKAQATAASRSKPFYFSRLVLENQIQGDLGLSFC